MSTSVRHAHKRFTVAAAACAAAYAKLGQGLDLDALEAAATAIGTSSRRRDETSKKRDADDAGEGQPKVSGVRLADLSRALGRRCGVVRMPQGWECWEGVLLQGGGRWFALHRCETGGVSRQASTHEARHLIPSVGWYSWAMLPATLPSLSLLCLMFIPACCSLPPSLLPAPSLQKKAKRKRKPRYPKGYDPTKPNGGLPAPDPERWLPKWQRSDAKKKQKRRRDRQVRIRDRPAGGLRPCGERLPVAPARVLGGCCA